MGTFRERYEAVRARKAPERLAENHRRLRVARLEMGYVPLRMMLQVPTAHPFRQWGSVLGQSLRINLPEAVDVWACWADVVRFLKAWRPQRIRSAQAQARVVAIWDEFERLSKETSA